MCVKYDQYVIRPRVVQEFCKTFKDGDIQRHPETYLPVHRKDGGVELRQSILTTAKALGNNLGCFLWVVSLLTIVWCVIIEQKLAWTYVDKCCNTWNMGLRTPLICTPYPQPRVNLIPAQWPVYCWQRWRFPRQSLSTGSAPPQWSSPEWQCPQGAFL